MFGLRKFQLSTAIATSATSNPTSSVTPSSEARLICTARARRLRRRRRRPAPALDAISVVASREIATTGSPAATLKAAGFSHSAFRAAANGRVIVISASRARTAGGYFTRLVLRLRSEVRELPLGRNGTCRLRGHLLLDLDAERAARGPLRATRGLGLGADLHFQDHGARRLLK